MLQKVPGCAEVSGYGAVMARATVCHVDNEHKEPTVSTVKVIGRTRNARPRRRRPPRLQHQRTALLRKTPAEMTDAELAARRLELRREIVMPPDAIERTVGIYERIILANC